MQLQDMIYKRKSFRKYKQEPVDAAAIYEINTFCTQLKPLHPDITVRAEVIGKENVKCLFPWVAPQVVAIFSEKKDGYLENVGFLFQQLDLYLQAKGFGSCWLGMGKLNTSDVAEHTEHDNLQFVIMLSFGYPKDELRNEASQFKRKLLSEITDNADTHLEPARLAPSSVNSQPWYFTHEGKVIHAYCEKRGLFKIGSPSSLNRIDMGIALGHMYVSYPDTFRFFRTDMDETPKGYAYIGSFTIS